MKRLLYILVVLFIASFSFESCSKLEAPNKKETTSFLPCGTSNDDPIEIVYDTNGDPIGITDSDDDEDHDKENTSN